jgi:hypothetical protein
MDKPQIDATPGLGATSIKLDLNDLALGKLEALDGSALQAIAQELSEDSGSGGQSKHHSHHSYSTHGTAAW